MTERKRIYVLNQPTLRICPGLAAEIGLNESIILLQMDFWISISDNCYDGRHWTYQSVRDMKSKAFNFWSIATINRGVNSLIKKGLLVEGNYNKRKYDKTRWFAIDFVNLAKLKSIAIKPTHDTRSNQNDTGSTQNETRSNQNETTIPEITTENTTETTTPNIPDSQSEPASSEVKTESLSADNQELKYVQGVVDWYNGQVAIKPNLVKKVNRPAKPTTLNNGRYDAPREWYKADLPLVDVITRLSLLIDQRTDKEIAGLNWFLRPVLDWQDTPAAAPTAIEADLNDIATICYAHHATDEDTNTKEILPPRNEQDLANPPSDFCRRQWEIAAKWLKNLDWQEICDRIREAKEQYTPTKEHPVIYSLQFYDRLMENGYET